MTHDPSCPSLRYVVLGGRVCVCETIAEVRQDMLVRCIAAAEAQQMYASTVEEIMVGFDCAKREILRALRALEDKP